MRQKISSALFTVGICLTVVTAICLLVITQPVVLPPYYFARTLVAGMILVALGVKMEMGRSR
jgi:hypothetical protein